MKKTIFLFFATLFILKSFPCGNYYFALNKEGNPIPLGYEWKFPFSQNFNFELNVGKLKKIEKKLRKEKNFMLLSDYSLCLMKLGKAKEAVEILSELYLHYPNEYKIASNLGTAYELTGENDSALKYIKRGIQLNPDDHEGSEWIHAKILETKLQIKKNPSYLSNHSVLQLSEKQKNDSTVFYHLDIQLKERFPFTPAPDEIMASLMTDLGDLSANVKSIEYARAYYQIAKYYYGSTSPDLDVKIKEMERLMKKYKNVPTPTPKAAIEGSLNRIHGIRYEDIISDNSVKNFTIEWDKINTNVDSLLALVDFTKTVKELKDSSISKPKDELNLIPDHKEDSLKLDSIPQKKEVAPDKTTGQTNNIIWFYVLGSILILVGGFFLLKKIFNK